MAEARAQYTNQTERPQCSRTIQAITLAGARVYSTGHMSCRNARTLHRPQEWPKRARAIHKQQKWPQRARTAQATGLAAARALYTRHKSGRSARALYMAQKWPLHARSTQAIGVAAARAHSTGHKICVQRADWPKREGLAQPQRAGKTRDADVLNLMF